LPERGELGHALSGVNLWKFSFVRPFEKASAATIDSLTSILASQPESGKHPIINKTGLTGRYDWSLRWTPDTLGGPEAEDQNAEQPSLITALHEQLGLRLISEKDLIEAIAIDHVEIPSDN
jgi:uncharacterized protein (TIGR03435 family)